MNEPRAIELQRMEYTIRHEVSDLVCGDNLHFKRFIDYETGGMIHQLRALLLGRINQEVIIKYPMDWWQAVKEHFAPKWFLIRWPVKYKEEGIRATELYPSLNTEDIRSRVVFQVKSFKPYQGQP